MFIDGLDPGIKTLVARHREEKRKLSYLELVQYARAEGDALRARGSTTRPKPAKALLAEPDSLSLMADRTPREGFDNVHVAHADGVSIPTTELPSTTESSFETAQDRSLLYVGNNRAQAPRVPFANGVTRNQRPGWVDNRSAGRFTDVRNVAPRSAAVPIICHLCYTHGHTSPQCVLSIREMAAVVANYEALTPEEKRTVPMASYLRAKTDFSHAVGQLPRTRAAPVQPVDPRPLANAQTAGYPGNPVQRNAALVVEEPGEPVVNPVSNQGN